MASNTLTSNSISTTYTQILHVGTGTAGVATVRIGDGTATAISFVSGGFKVTGTFEATGNTTIGGTMTVAGQITALGVPVYKRMTADVTATTTGSGSLSAFDFTPVSGAVYEIEMALIASTTNAANGIKINNTGGAGTLVMASPNNPGIIASTGGSYIPADSPSNIGFLLILKGIFIASSTAALSWTVSNEATAYNSTIAAQSVLKITRIS